MEFNDGSQYRVVTDPQAQFAAGREVYCFRTASARNLVSYVDTAHERHRQSMSAIPLLVMYQYVYWRGDLTPESQAQFFVDTVKELRPNEAVMLDLEPGASSTPSGLTTANVAEFAQRWCAVVEPALKTRAWLYIPKVFSDALESFRSDRVVMAPHYSATPSWPHDVHQYTDRGQFPGCPDPAGGDVSRTTLTVSQLLARSQPRGETMAVYSQNGYLANDRSVLARFVVSDSGLYMNFRNGPAGELLANMVRWFDKNIRNIDPGILDDWSYAEREIRGGVELSNHASGTAADVDATKWPLGSAPEVYLTAAEIAKIRERLKIYEGCIRWGGDYTGRKDPMHFEINKDEATCARVWKKIQALESAPALPTEENDMYASIEPGTTQVIPLPPGDKTLTFAVDEGDGGANVRVAVGWGKGQYHSLAGLDKVDGFTGWVVNGVTNTWKLGNASQTATITVPLGLRSPVGVLVSRV